MSKKAKKARRAAQRRKVQKRFKSRVAAGKSGLTGGKKGTGPAGRKGSTISNYRAAQKKQVQDAARARNKAFQAARTGLNSKKLGAEATRLTGIPSGADLQPGMLTFSKEGIAQAEANKEAARKEAIRKSKFDPSRLSSSFTGNTANNNLGINTIAALGNPAVRNFAATSFDKASSWYNKGRLPNESKMSIRDLFRNDLKQQQQIGKFNPKRTLNFASYARGESNPFRGMPGYGTITGQGEIKGGFQTGPTPSVRQAIERPLRTAFGIGKFFVNPKAAILAAVSAPTPLADGTLEGKPTRFDTQAGGLNIGRSDSGEATGRSLTSRALGAVDAVVGTDLDKLGGRTTPFGERLTSSIDSFGTLRKNMSDLGINMGGDLSLKGLQNTAKNISTTGKKLSMEDLAASTSFAKAFKDKPLDAVANLNPDGSKRVIKTLQTLDKNKDVSEALANYGGEGFQKGLRDTASLASDNYDKLSTDAKANRKVVSNMLMGNDPRSEFAKRLAFQQKENPQLSMQSKIKYASDPNFKQFTGKGFENKIKGINKKEMGITGSVGNFLLSNQGRDVVTGNLPGTNNALDLASNIINTGRDPSSSTYDASQSFLRTIGAGGQPTPGSIIRGVNPFRRRSGGGTRQQTQRGGGTAAPVGQLPQVQNPAEIPLPVIPHGTIVNQEQQGTQASTLSNIQNQSYQNTFNNLMAQFRPRRMGGRRTFRTSFNRDYFSQFV